jgi:anti-sigma factor RsiW
MDHNGTEHDGQTWDEQREWLSAYTDGELAADETRQLEAHIATCAACRNELAALRQVRAVLRALPEPRLPRSFTLPPSGPLPVPAAALARRQQAERHRSPMLARATQWAGGVAAAAGLALVLGSALVGLGGHSAASSSEGGTASSGSYSPYIPPTATSRNAGAAVAPRNTSSAAQSAPASTRGPEASTATATPAPSAQAEHSMFEGGSSGGDAPIAPLTGAGLLVGGGALLIGGRVAERRHKRRS